MDRRLLAALALVVLLGLAGCSTIFGSDAADRAALSEDATYEFDTDRDAYIEINSDNYTAVYNVSARKGDDEDPTIQLYTTDALSVEQPLELRALKFRHPNGTVDRFVDGNATRVYENGTTEEIDALRVETSRKRTTVHLPADEGKLAFTTPKDGKEVTIRTVVSGSYEVVLPPDTDASLPLLSQVGPSNDGRQVEGDRVHLTWEELDSDVLVVRWYLDRDVWLFGGLATVALVVGVVGGVYYYLQIREARRRREEEGIDVDYDDDREGPPPGMR
jgi:hypothetical protein